MIPPTDLTQRPPRSPRIRLGGYTILARCLDKGRALLAGTIGEYHFACPLDQSFFTFVGIDGDALKVQLATGKSDFEILEWVELNAKTKRSAWEIETWSRFVENETAGDIDFRAFFSKLHQAANPKREDLFTLFEVLDVDDYVTFGGKA